MQNALLSFHELTQSPCFRWPDSHLPTGVLKIFDLPDVYRALRDRNLTVIDPWDGLFRPWQARAGRAHARDLGIPLGRLQFRFGRAP